jgi:hypothetical protein
MATQSFENSRPNMTGLSRDDAKRGENADPIEFHY